MREHKEIIETAVAKTSNASSGESLALQGKTLFEKLLIKIGLAKQVKSWRSKSHKSFGKVPEH